MPVVTRVTTQLVERRMNKAVLLRIEIEQQLQYNVGHVLTPCESEKLLSLIDQHATAWMEAIRRCA